MVTTGPLPTCGIRVALWLLGAAAVAGQAAAPLGGGLVTRAGGVVQVKGTVPLAVEGTAVAKRYVLRYPESGWNGSLVVGAHGGSGGSNFARDGQVIGTDETALDDVIGRHARRVWLRLRQRRSRRRDQRRRRPGADQPVRGSGGR